MLDLPYPIVAKPIIGCGGRGVKVCHDKYTLFAHLKDLVSQGQRIMLKQYLGGEEATVIVMPPNPPTSERQELANMGLMYLGHTSLGLAMRNGHQGGVAPSLDLESVVDTSCLEIKGKIVFATEDVGNLTEYEAILNESEIAARCLHATAPIQIDVRRCSEGGQFFIFDVNTSVVSHPIPTSALST